VDHSDVQAAWDDVAAAYADARDPDGPETALIDDLLAELPPDPTVLDVGCGDGARTLANLPRDAVGVDFSRAGLELAADDGLEGRLAQGDMVSLPVETDSVDGITAYFAVFHVDRDRHAEVYEEFARVLRPGGWVVATLPGGRYETVRRGWMGGEMFFSTPGREATLSKLRAAGFDEIRTEISNDPLGSSTEFVFARLG
jgi:Methylase involved in ubiquinone/menaquinone biosynthesis